MSVLLQPNRLCTFCSAGPPIHTAHTQTLDLGEPKELTDTA